MLYKLVCALCIVAASAFNAPAASKFGLAAAPAVRAVRAAPMVVMEEVEDKVKAIIAEQLGVEASSVTPESSFTEDLGADSLDAVELIMAIEEVRTPCAERQRRRQHTHTLDWTDAAAPREGGRPSAAAGSVVAYNWEVPICRQPLHILVDAAAPFRF